MEQQLKQPDLLVDSVSIGCGIFLAILLGAYCKLFLNRSVRAKAPLRIKLQNSEEDGGSKQLGSLEILLFFASLWLEAHAAAAGWLAFKVAAKWASWQHIAKIPQERIHGDYFLDLLDRLRLSNHLLGSFLNGTLYNVFCAGTGFFVAKLLAKNPQIVRTVLPTTDPVLIVALLLLFPVVVVFSLLFAREAE